MLDFYLLSVVAFFAVLAVLIYRDRKKVFHSPRISIKAIMPKKI